MGRDKLAAVISFAALACFAQVSSAATIMLTPSKDNTLYQDATGSLSNGMGPVIFAGKNGQGQNLRAVLAFDLGPIPAGSIIEDVRLELHVSTPQENPTTPVSMHRLLKDWGEGTSNVGGGSGASGAGGAGGAPAQTGDATWQHTFFNTQFWTNDGGDFVAAASATASVSGSGDPNWSSNGLVADVQAWLDDPASNFGWILLGNETQSGSAKRFDSLQNATAANRPLLTVEYTPIPIPPALVLLGSGLLALAGVRRRRTR